MVSVQQPAARIVHRIPGRVRVSLPNLPPYPDVINMFVEQIRGIGGVERVTVSIVSGRALIIYDSQMVDERQLVNQVNDVLQSMIAAEKCPPADVVPGPEVKQAGEEGASCRKENAASCSKFNFFLSAGAAGILGIKRLFWGPSAMALSPGLFYAAAATSLITGYPLIRRGINMLFSGGRTDDGRILQSARETLALARENVPGLSAAATEHLIAMDEAQAREKTARSLGQSLPAPEKDLLNDEACPAGEYAMRAGKLSMGLAATAGLLARSWNRGLSVALAGSPGPARLIKPAASAGVMQQALARGVAIKDYRAFSNLDRSEVILFSSGDLLNVSASLGETYTAPGYKKKDVLALVATLCIASEQGSVKKSGFANLTRGEILPDCKIIDSSSVGITGLVKNEQVKLGKAAYVGHVNITAWAKNKVTRLSHLNQSPLFILKGNKVCGVLGVQYNAHPETLQAIHNLKAHGRQVAVFCGHDDGDSKMLARLYAIETVFRAPSAQEKLHVINNLKQQGTSVALVTTGQEDSRLMQEVPVTIGLGKTNAHISVVSGELGGIAEAVHLAHVGRAKMQQGIFSLKILNAVGMTLAAAGRISTRGAALYLSLTSLAVGWLARRVTAPRQGIPSHGPDNPERKDKSTDRTRPNAKMSVISSSGPHKEWAPMANKRVLELLGTDLSKGLSPEEVSQRLAKFGENRLAETKPPTIWQRFTDQLNNLLVKTLMGSTVMCVILGELGDAVAIVTIVLLNAIFGMLQEHKADQSLAALKKMSAPTAKAVRGGQQQVVPVAELVPGDVVVLEQGDIVPADLRLLQAVSLEIEEAALTGESYPVVKGCQPRRQEFQNMAFSGTTVTRGRGLGVVVATGMGTELGKIAGYLQEEKNGLTPLQRRMEHISTTVLKCCLLVTGVVVAAGVARGHGVLSMFMTGVTLAVAAIPEGLPATVTVAMAAGVRRMARENAVVRRLPGIETLGNTTVICCDKTGTLTKNELTVRAVYCPGQLWQVSGSGYDPENGCYWQNNVPVQEPSDLGLISTLSAAVLCNDSSLEKVDAGRPGKGSWVVSGDPLEGAFLVAARKAGINYQRLRKQHRRLWEQPFDSERGYMITVNAWEEEGSVMVSAKGALEKILPLCSNIQINGETVPLDNYWRQKILAVNEQLTRNSLRVLALARRYQAGEGNTQYEGPEQNMVFLGLLGLIDPLRPEVKGAVVRCRRAGIKVCIITGDHGNTAQSIGAQLGLENHNRVVTGYQLDLMRDAELASVIQDVRIFARVLPKHKLRLVKAFRSRGEVVTMIGDGVNDAPAVKEADVGVAMGTTGTDVTKQASVIIVTDDNFATLVKAIEQGRSIFENIKRSVGYQLATNAGEVIMMLLTVALGMPLPLLPIQLLWLNLLGDGLPALALGIDKPAPGVMEKEPRSTGQSFFSEGLGKKIISRGTAIGLTTTVAYGLTLKALGGIGPARTVALSTLTLSQFLYAVGCRRENSDRNSKSMPPNRYLSGSLLVSTALLVGAVYLPAGQAVLKTAALNPLHWMVVAGGTFLGVGLDGLMQRLWGKSNPLQGAETAEEVTNTKGITCSEKRSEKNMTGVLTASSIV